MPTMRFARRRFKRLPPSERHGLDSFRAWARATYKPGECAGKLAGLLDHARGRKR